MIELWLIFALIALLIGGFKSFVLKISSEIKLNKNIMAIFINIFGFIFALFFFIFFGETNSSFIYPSLLIIFLAICDSLVYIFIVKTKLFALEYLSSSTLFINQKIFVSIVLIFSGLIFFDKGITTFQFIGFILGFFCFYLLLEKNQEKGLKKDMKKGLIFLAGVIIFISFSVIINQKVVLLNYNIFNYLVIVFFFGTLFSSFLFRKEFKTPKKFLEKKYLILGGITGMLGVSYTIFFLKALFEGNLAIVYKITSYSIFVPIILSILIYKEKVTPKKVVAFILTIISLWFFLN